MKLQNGIGHGTIASDCRYPLVLVLRILSGDRRLDRTLHLECAARPERPGGRSPSPDLGPLYFRIDSIPDRQKCPHLWGAADHSGHLLPALVAALGASGGDEPARRERLVGSGPSQ